MAPSKPFTPIVPMSQGQGNPGPSEEEHRRTGGLFFEPSPKPCSLEAFLASLQPPLA